LSCPFPQTPTKTNGVREIKAAETHQLVSVLGQNNSQMVKIVQPANMPKGAGKGQPRAGADKGVALAVALLWPELLL
jgi:hypothetical protein